MGSTQVDSKSNINQMELEQPNDNITNQIENLKIKIENILQQRK